jgi:hypothetical protein
MVARPPMELKIGGTNPHANRNFSENLKNTLSMEFKLTIDGYGILSTHMFHMSSILKIINRVNLLGSARTLANLRKLHR